MISSIAGIFGGISGAGGEAGNIFDAVNEAIGLLGVGGSQGSNQAAAYLNYLVFDKNLSYKFGGYVDVSGSSSTMQNFIIPNITIQERGYIYIYLSNESTAQEYAFFDDMNIEITSPIVQTDDYYPFGLTFNEYQNQEEQGNFNLYQGKELQEDLGLNTYDFHARMYDPTIGRTFQQDPLSDKYYPFSPYSWSANNPLIFVDPTGMVIEEGSQKEWDKQKGRVEKRRDKLQSKASKLSSKAKSKGWSSEKLSKKLGNKNKRIGSLNSSLETLSEIENSSQVYSLQSGVEGEGGVTYDSNTGNVVISYGSTANFVHETTHAGQFQAGHMAFAANGKTFGQDLWDEVAGYKAQFAYDPFSVSRLTASSVAKSFRDITPGWIQGIVGSSGKLYAPGGNANTGQVPVNINSGKAQLLRAYPNAAGYLRGKPANYKLKDESGIILSPFDEAY